MTTKTRVLFLGANPADVTALGLGQEYRAIQKEVRASEHRDSLELVWDWATRPEDLQSALNQHRPHVIHFSGHGSPVGEILLEDANGKSSSVSPETLKRLLENLKDNIQLVFLNACFSEIQAQAIIAIIDCAIGMKAPIPDSAAIIFAAAFYRAIAYGRSIQNAFNQGKDELDLSGLLAGNVPELLVRHGVDPDRIVLVGPPTTEVDRNEAEKVRHGRVPSLTVQSFKAEADKKQPLSWTNPTGRSFLSYHRSRIQEARLLIAAQHDRGIPTCHDLKELDEEQSENSIRRTLADSGTANAILWLTPELRSDARRQLEIGSSVERAGEKAEQDSFWVCPVLAGGLEAEKLAAMLDSRVSEQLNLCRVSADPISPVEAAEVARRVLLHRVAAIHEVLPEGESLRLQLFTRPSAVMTPGTALLVDWVERFEGRLAKSGAWEQFLLPALQDVAEAVQTRAFERAIEVSGLSSIPAATALGCVFLAPRGLKVAWRQPTLGRDDQLWSNDAAREPSGFRIDLSDGPSRAKDVAALISVAHDTEPAFNASRKSLPPFRSIIRVRKPGANSSILETAGQARDVAQLVVEGIQTVLSENGRIGRVHLFMSVPVGLAMMIGQLLNTLGSVQTYEHIRDDGVGHYRPAFLLYPSG